MGNFDLNQYATVDERIHAFYQKFEDGRILTKRVTKDPEGNVEIFKAYLYRTPAEQERDLPLATGYAQEVRDEELQISQQGYEYASVNYTAWLENCETSAIGRALANAGFTGNKNRPSREEMEKVKRTEEKAKTNGHSKNGSATKQAVEDTKQQVEQEQDDVAVETKEAPKGDEGKDDAQHSNVGEGVQATIDSFTTKKDLIEWWKERMDDDSDGSFRSEWQPRVYAKLEELK